MPGEVNDFASEEPEGSPVRQRRVSFTGAITLDAIQQTPPDFEVYGQVEYGIDANGRAQKAELLEPDPNGALLAVGSKEYNDLGEVTRSREIDGTITRQTRDQVGHVLRTYVGTDDTDWPIGGSGGFNMILTERTEYGLGEGDAWRPTIVRRYDGRPSWADSLGYYDEPEDDAEGYATRTSYDWRMRPVRVDVHDKGDPNVGATLLATTLTFLDHADRARLVVSFGSGAVIPAALDPSQLDAGGEMLPAAIEFYALTPKPTSIIETFYSADGTQTERRMYDMGWNGTGSPPYHADRQYAGLGGQTVFSQQPGQPLQVTRQDGLGRTRSTASIIPGVGNTLDGRELTRTDFVHDADGNVIDTISWERVIDDGVDALSATNAVRTRTVTWFDVQKRVIASAELGTEAGSFTSSPTGYDRLAHEDAPSWSVAGQTVTTDRQGLPESASLWIYTYDRTGNQKYVVAPNETLTEFVYGRTGRLASKIENPLLDEDDQGRRETWYEYQYGRLVEMRAILPGNRPGGTVPNSQDTLVIHGADVVDAQFGTASETRSRNNALIGQVQFPAPETGEPGAVHTLTFAYNYAGQLAERVDSRGAAFRYHYDALGRLSRIQVGHYDGGAFIEDYPSSMDGPTGNPVDRVTSVEYGYDNSGRLADVWTNRIVSPASVLTHNRFEYEANGQLKKDQQALGAFVGALTPTTSYTWQSAWTGPTSAEPGHTRLTQIKYPKVGTNQVRQIDIAYGASGSTDDRISRIQTLKTHLGNGPQKAVAAFTYAGTSRRASLSLDNDKITQSYALAGVFGLGGLDAYGHPADLHYQNAEATPKTLFRSQYTYDSSGNRLTARITQWPTAAFPVNDNLRSQQSSYDELNRLVSVEVGSLIGGVIDPISDEYRADSWLMDRLGNWAGHGVPGDVGRRSVGNLDGHGTPWADPAGSDAAEDALDLTHEVNFQNEISGIVVDDDGTPASIAPIYDAVGNLIFDGEYYYQYDAWNRLVQVNEAAADAQGQPIVGALLKHLTYDGLGRLVRVQSPLPDAATAEGRVRSERMYYDGIRRVQETILDELAGIEEASASGDPELMLLADAPEGVDESAASAMLEQGQTAEASGGGGAGPSPVTPSLAMEYCWGPGDNGLDELFCEFDSSRVAWYVLQDAGGDVMAVVDVSAADGVARVAGQWTYDAYGQVQSYEEVTSHPVQRVGHKGLFCDRVDVGIAAEGGGGSYVENPRLRPYGVVAYSVRNRTYLPKHGRWAQADPNATGMSILMMLASHGDTPAIEAIEFRLLELYRDGNNLFTYLSASPFDAHDPLGLYGSAFIDFAVPGPSDFIGGMLTALTEEYSYRLEDDVDWAMDWERDDDDLSRLESSWINIAIFRGLYEAFDPTHDPLTDF